MKVSLIDYMGSDLTVVNAARVSFNKESKRVKVAHYYDLSEKDQKLISYLAQHAHWSPFNVKRIICQKSMVSCRLFTTNLVLPTILRVTNIVAASGVMISAVYTLLNCLLVCIRSRWRRARAYLLVWQCLRSGG